MRFSKNSLPIFLLFFFSGLLLWPAPLQGEDRELERKKKELKRHLDEMVEIITRPRKSTRYLLRHNSKILRIIGKIKDKHPSQKDWAYKARYDFKKLKRYLKIFIEFHEIYEKQPEKLKKYREELDEKLEKITESMKKEIKGLKRDLRELDRSERRVDKLQREMKELGREVKYYLKRNKDMAQMKKHYYKLKSFYGKTDEVERVEKAFKKGIRLRSREAAKKMKNLRYKYRKVPQGIYYPPFKELNKKYEDLVETLRKNAKEVIELSKKIKREKKETDNEIKEMANNIRYGKIKRVMTEDVALYKKLLRFYKDLKRSVVFSALDTDWIPQYGRDLKRLYPILKSLREIQEILEKLEEELKKLPRIVKKDFKYKLDKPLRQGDFKALGEAVDEIQKKYKKIRENHGNQARQVVKIFRRLRFRFQTRRFRIVKDYTKRTYQKWLREARRNWKEAYKDEHVEWAIKGRKARGGPFREGLEKLYSKQAQDMEKDLTTWGRDFKSGQIPSSSRLDKIRREVEELYKWCGKNNLPRPRWIEPLRSDLEELDECLPVLERFQKNNDALEGKIKKFQRWCHSEHDRLKSEAQSAKDIDDFIPLRKKIAKNSQKAISDWKGIIGVLKKGLSQARKGIKDRPSTKITRQVYDYRASFIEKEAKSLIESLKEVRNSKKVLVIMRGVHK